MFDAEKRRLDREKRRKRAFIQRIILAVLLIVFIVCMVILTSALKSGYELDPTNVISVHYSGYNGMASAEVVIDQEKLTGELNAAYDKYHKSIWPLIKKLKIEDYQALSKDFTSSLDKTSEISNGDEIKITLDYDKDLADKLKVSLKYTEIPLTVADVSEGTVLSQEDIFKDVSIQVEGVSPRLLINLVNNSEDEFLQNVTYTIKDEKEFYRNGETVTVQAVYDSEQAVLARYDLPAGTPEKQYTISNEYLRYVDSTADIPTEVLKEAIERGKECFTGANEYGLRIFTEAGLPYTWVGTQDYTFEWSEPRIISSYVETVKDEYIDNLDKTYNYLELAYEVHIEQANGVGCDAEAVVCFDSMTIDKDGKVNLNENSAQLYTASYLDKNIKESLNGWFGDDYNLDKFDISALKQE